MRIRRYDKRRGKARGAFQQHCYLRQECVDFDPHLLRVKPPWTSLPQGLLAR